MQSDGVAPDWLSILFMIVLWLGLPLKAWRIDYPASVKARNKRTAPRYKHEFKD